MSVDRRRDPRRDPRARVERDLARRRHREGGPAAFTRALALIGSVGWPIVLLTAGGALLGSYLDQHLQTSPRWALCLLFAGLVSGIILAYRALTEDSR
jgi:ATP synthase protein I